MNDPRPAVDAHDRGNAYLLGSLEHVEMDGVGSGQSGEEYFRRRRVIEHRAMLERKHLVPQPAELLWREMHSTIDDHLPPCLHQHPLRLQGSPNARRAVCFRHSLKVHRRCVIAD